MYFLVDNQLKIIFGFSAKCGCTNVRKLFLSFTKEDHILNLYNLKRYLYVGQSRLPKDISSFRIYIFIRNPYERICSGFFDKYNKKHPFRKFWKNEKELTFKNFVNTITVEGIGKQINTHHFTPQTTEFWEDRLLESQNVKFIDIKDLYKVKEDIYKKVLNKTIVSNKINKKSKNYIANAYDIQIDELIKMSPDYKCLYNHELKEKVYNFYKKDFEIFKKFGFDYDI